MSTSLKNIPYINIDSLAFKQHHVTNGIAIKSSQTSVLSVHNVSYVVKVTTKVCREKTDKTILSDITAVFKEGLTAVMGPTGSGKSTLMDILASRKETSGMSGLLLLDGKPVPANYKCMVGYVVQDDVLMGTLSVRENIQFSAALRLPTTVSTADKQQRVNKAIKELELDKCADTKVGNEFIRGVSGGERKRCNIGMELVISPSVLFLDEPTTGLDATTANTVLMILKRLSRRGRTIIFSIHQPRYTIYSLFDNLLLLYAGSVVYSGPSHEALDFFASQGFRCQVHNNPPDFFMDVINGLEKPLNDRINTWKDDVYVGDSASPQNWLVSAFRQSYWNRRLQEQATAILSRFEAHTNVRGTRNEHANYTTTFFHQVGVLAGRTLKSTLRDPQTSMVTIIASVMFSALLSAIFWQLKEDPVSGFKDRSGVLFFLVVNQLFFNLAALDVFIKERKIFMHESSSGFYRVSVYFLVKIAFDIIPQRTVPVIIMPCIIYFSIGLNQGADHFFLFMFTLFCATIAGASLCFLVSSTFRDIAFAVVVLALTCILMMLFSGFLISFDSIGPWLNWAQYISFFKYALAALYINEFKDRVFCNTNATIRETGNNFLKIQQIDFSEPWDFWQNHVALLVCACCTLFLTYIQLRRMKKTI